MTRLRLLQSTLALLVVLPSVGEAGQCTGRLTPEQFEACRARQAHNAAQYNQSRAAVREAERRLEDQASAARQQQRDADASMARFREEQRREAADARARALHQEQMKAYRRMGR
jgi:hypothetical protein